jgi:type II secretory pathway pseudopilin PulG
MKPMTHPTRGHTLVELLAVLLALAVLMGFTFPVLRAVACDEKKAASIRNLQTLHIAQVMYAADWDDRQVTFARDDLGAYNGDPVAYNLAHGCQDPFDEGCQPPVVAGLDCDGTLRAYDLPGGAFAVQPIGFPGGPGAAGWGSFRMPNTRPLHDYVNGRYHDPTFYAPKDRTVIGGVQACLDSDCEFDAACNPGWSSYCFSPAAMFHPDVLASNPDAGGQYWRTPWTFTEGYQSPTVSQAEYPAQKTRMLEHSWVQNPAAWCNPQFLGCEPYHGYFSIPMTLFFDGHVAGLSVSEAMRSDARMLAQTGGAVPLWSRSTPFGSDGYYQTEGFDFAETSFHILTVDGIRGRDTLE